MTSNDATTDPGHRSFIDVAADHPFPIQNLPLGIACRGDQPASVVTAIGDYVVDLTVLDRAGMLPTAGRAQDVYAATALNELAACGPDVRCKLRQRLSELLDAGEASLRDDPQLRSAALYPLSEAVMQLPFRIGDYTDFYSSREHATNVGTMFRGPDNALQPNWLHLPVGYHGRASSVVTSGTPIRRPWGQTQQGDQPPRHQPCKALDFELEMGYFIGQSNTLGMPVPAAEAESHVFGLSLVNDWSARDIQRWEYVPLGPFLAKNFATSLSPWVVTLEALEPFRCQRVAQEPRPLPYLDSAPALGAFDIRLEVDLLAAGSDQTSTICRSNFRYLYWSIAQQVAHHTVTGCNLRTGDLLASGTISGPTEDSYGSMLELAWRGERPLQLADGSHRSMLQDGDTLIMRGWCQGDGYRIGLGEVVGTVLPAHEGQSG